MSHDEYRELLAAHALGGLEPAEARALEGHLEGCDECRAELGALRETAGSLALTVDPVAPPAELRARVLEGVRAQRTKPFPAGRRRAPVWRRPAPIVSGLAVAAGLAWLVVLQVESWRELDETRARLDQALARLDQTQEILARERAARRLWAEPDAVSVVLGGTAAAPQARAKVAYEPATGEAVLFAADLPPPPPGKGYQLWFIAGGRPPLPGKVFSTDSSGRGELTDRIPPEGRTSPVFAVTLEPAGGAPAPTGPIVLVSAKS